MGVEFEQHPEMWKAVVIQVPLLDMLGYEHMSAGASWVGEYGSAQRAGRAGVSGVDFAVQPAEAGREISRAADLHDDRG